YYYDLDDSYDESDEEEVRAHLRRVAEQPPLKLDTSSEKLEFLQIFGLTTQQEKERLLQQKRRKRRRMLRERSQSPPTIQIKRQTPSPHSPLSTRFSPDELNNSPNLEEKKKFLTFFDLSHVSAEKRRGPAPEDQLPAPPSTHPDPPAPVASTSSSCTVSVPEIVKPLEPLRLEPHNVDHRKLLESTRVPPLQLPVLEPTRVPPLQLPVLEPTRVPPLQLPVQPPVTNAPSADKIRQVEAPPAKKSLSILNFVRGHTPKENPVQPSQSMNGRNKSWEPFLAEEFAHQFHESVLQSTQKALQKHKDQNIERHVLETQCKRLDTQHYNLSLTAEQLSHRMAELMSQKQRVASERDRLQAELEHFRKCLVLPSSLWSRGYFKGHPR
ncbi:hypothetical protein AB205_0149710, partial [Aquarana catesbeiana]